MEAELVALVHILFWKTRIWELVSSFLAQHSPPPASSARATCAHSYRGSRRGRRRPDHSPPRAAGGTGLLPSQRAACSFKQGQGSSAAGHLSLERLCEGEVRGPRWSTGKQEKSWPLGAAAATATPDPRPPGGAPARTRALRGEDPATSIPDRAARWGEPGTRLQKTSGTPKRLAPTRGHACHTGSHKGKSRCTWGLSPTPVGSRQRSPAWAAPQRPGPGEPSPVRPAPPRSCSARTRSARRGRRHRLSDLPPFLPAPWVRGR